MKKIETTGKFRKDVKRYRYRPEKMAALKTIVDMLQEGVPIPQEYNPHMLSGRYKDCMECHVENDFLLIWIDETKTIVRLMRLGTHHELFGL